MKYLKKIMVIIFTVFVLSNIWPFTDMLKVTVDGDRYYRYSNFDGSNTSYEFKSWTFEMAKSQHNDCLKQHPNQRDKNLYRLFSKNPLAFWRWRLYFFDERYDLPYKNWDEIEKIRRNTKSTMGCYIRF